jgi:hypothetical protein
MTAKVLMVAKSRAIEARSVKHRGEKRRFCFGRPAMTPGTPLVRFGWEGCPNTCPYRKLNLVGEQDLRRRPSRAGGTMGPDTGKS